MKYHAIAAALWALLSVLSFGFSLIFAGFGEQMNALVACAVCLVTGILHIMHAELAKPKSWSGPYCR
jgi:uncharacterized membrane protein